MNTTTVIKQTPLMPLASPRGRSGLGGLLKEGGSQLHFTNEQMDGKQTNKNMLLRVRLAEHHTVVTGQQDQESALILNRVLCAPISILPSYTV